MDRVRSRVGVYEPTRNGETHPAWWLRYKQPPSVAFRQHVYERVEPAGQLCAHWTSLVASRWLRERVRWASGINLMQSLPPQMAPNAGPRDE